MKPWPLAVLSLLALSLLPAPCQTTPAAQTGIGATADFQAAIRALADDLPSVAADKLERLFTTQEATLTAAERAILLPTLLESLARAGRSERALALTPLEPLPTHASTPFWKAIALQQQSKFAEADAELAPYLARPTDPLFVPAAMTRANLQLALGKPEAALSSLAPVLALPADSPDRAKAALKSAEITLGLGKFAEVETALAGLPSLTPKLTASADYLRARLKLLQNKPAEAEKAFKDLVDRPRFADLPLFHASHLGLADALAAQGKTDQAIDFLIQFINTSPEGDVLLGSFQRLDHYGFFQRPRVHTVLASWSTTNNPDLRALCLYYGASVNPETALASLEKFRDGYPRHPLYPLAMTRLAHRYIESQQAGKAVALLTPLSKGGGSPEVEAAIAHLLGRAQFESGQYKEAISGFEGAAGASDPDAIFNKAVSAIYAKAPAIYQLGLQELALFPNGAEYQAELQLERGLRLAAASDLAAFEELKAFVREYPSHPRVVEAELALAELYLLEFPPKAATARKQLEAVRQRSLTPALAEQADYVAMWIEISADNPDGAIEIGRAFVAKWTQSPRRSEVRMRLGELSFAKKDYPNAQTQFELIAQEDSSGPFAETALYLAGKAASLSMNTTSVDKAIELWGQVVDRGGRLAEEARRQQALAKLKMDNPDAAIVVLDRVLESGSKLTPELRVATLLNKGQAYLRKAEKDPNPTEKLIAGIAAYDQVMDMPGVGRYWKNQAGVYKGLCLEKLDDPDHALEVYYDIVSRSPETGLRADEAPEFTWYYRAGFAAIVLLQKQQQWKAAVKMADKLAKTSGLRATEAAELANRLRLEHFVWEEPDELAKQ